MPDPKVDRLVAQLIAEVTAAQAIGIAAPQIGSLLRIAVVRHEGVDVVLINPAVVASGGTQSGWEACLSVAHLVGWVTRPSDVTVTSVDLLGRPQRHRGRGLAARAFLHELDHLDGRLYLDGLDPGSLVDTREHPTPPALPAR